MVWQGEGKLHCNEEGKLLIVCQVEGNSKIVVTSEGKLQSCQEEGKTPYYVVKGKLQIACQVEEKLQIVGSSGGKTPNGFVKWRENSKWLQDRKLQIVFVLRLALRDFNSRKVKHGHHG